MSDLTTLLEERANTLHAKIADLKKRKEQLEQELRRHEDSLLHVEALLMEERIEAQGPLPKYQLFSEPVPMRRPRKRKSIPVLVAEVLAEKGRPMHADEIRAELEVKGHEFSAKDPKASVVTALIRGKDRGWFEQVAPNTFRSIRSPHLEQESFLEPEGKETKREE